jgi:hypothetical protein
MMLIPPQSPVVPIDIAAAQHDETTGYAGEHCHKVRRMLLGVWDRVQHDVGGKLFEGCLEL